MKKIISALLIICMFATMLVVQTSAEVTSPDITSEVKFIYDIDMEELGLNIIKEDAQFVVSNSFVDNNTGKAPGAATRSMNYTLIDGTNITKDFPAIWLNDPEAATGLSSNDAKLEYNFNVEATGTYEIVFVMTGDRTKGERGFGFAIDDGEKSLINIESIVSYSYSYTYSYEEMIFEDGGDHYYQMGYIYGYTVDLTAGSHKLSYYHYEDLGTSGRPNFNGFYVQPETTVESGICGDKTTWTIQDNTLIIGGEGDMETYTSESATPWSLYSTSIEQVLIQKDVTSISEYTFKNYSNLKKVIFGSSLSTFPATGFDGCDALETFLTAGNIDGIDENTFKNTNLKTLVMKKAGENAFSMDVIKNCPSLERLSVMGEITTLQSGDFDNFAELKNVNIAVVDLDTGIPANLFKEKTNLETLSITGNVGSIGESAFEGCTALKDFKIVGNLTSIDKNAFKGCTNLKDFEFLVYSQVVSIGDNAFEGCTSLENVKPGKSVTSIGANAYKDCTGITNVDIKVEMTSIGDGAFIGCPAITAFKYAGTTEEWIALVGDNKVVEDEVVIKCSNGDITPEGVVEITTKGDETTLKPETADPATTTDSKETTSCSCGKSSIFITIAAFVSAMGVVVFTKKRI